MKFAPYEMMFQLVRTHVLLPSTSLTAAGVYDALRRGHAYAALELISEAKGFMFLAKRGRQTLGIMGDQVTFIPDLRLTASLPTPAELTLYRDGEAVERTIGRTWEIPVTRPGVYRLEAARHGKPWIISNPIYVATPTLLERLVRP
jgi:hypothetical protein